MEVYLRIVFGPQHAAHGLPATAVDRQPVEQRRIECELVGIGLAAEDRVARVLAGSPERDVAGHDVTLAQEDVAQLQSVRVAADCLAVALARFVADYPRIVVRVMMRDWDELMRRLRAREIEFFVAEISTFGSENDLDIEPLEPHPTFILARRGHPLAGRGPLGLADGFGFPYASLTRIPPRSLGPIQMAQRRSPDTSAAYRAFPALEFNSLDAVRKIVLGSDALMVAPPACVAEELEDGRLVALGSEPYLAVRYGIVRLKGQPLTAAGVRFREYVLESERTFTEQERVLFERFRPRPLPQGSSSTAQVAPRGRRRAGRRAVT